MTFTKKELELIEDLIVDYYSEKPLKITKKIHNRLMKLLAKIQYFFAYGRTK